MSLISLCIIEGDPECEGDDAGDHLGRAARAGDAGQGVVAVPAVPCQDWPAAALLTCLSWRRHCRLRAARFLCSRLSASERHYYSSQG